MVEGDHRGAAWRIVLDHIPENERRSVVQAMEWILQKWLLYRDQVAAECGLIQGDSGLPALDERAA
jgi:pyrroloquinoline-quinone synthase